MSAESARTSIVVGASRGLGHGIAMALAAVGGPVVGVSRTAPAEEPAGSCGQIRSEIADATDEAVAGRLLDRHDPQVLVLVAGTTPHMAALPEQTWETFSLAWETDVRMAFFWLTAVLRRPLRPGSRVVVISSGAAIAGSPLSGGYAGAKATQRFITGYAQDEADRAGLDLTFTSVLPRFAPDTGVGAPAVRAYAAAANRSVPDFLRQLGPTVTPQLAGKAVVELLGTKAVDLVPAYLLTGAGLQPLP